MNDPSIGQKNLLKAGDDHSFEFIVNENSVHGTWKFDSDNDTDMTYSTEVLASESEFVISLYKSIPEMSVFYINSNHDLFLIEMELEN